MELQHTEEYKPSGDVDSTFNLVSKLVTEMFLEEDEELVITAKSGEFFHDSSTSVEVVDPVAFDEQSIKCVEVKGIIIAGMNIVSENLDVRTAADTHRLLPVEELVLLNDDVVGSAELQTFTSPIPSGIHSAGEDRVADCDIG